MIFLIVVTNGCVLVTLIGAYVKNHDLFRFKSHPRVIIKSVELFVYLPVFVFGESTNLLLTCALSRWIICVLVWGFNMAVCVCNQHADYISSTQLLLSADMVNMHFIINTFVAV